MRTSNRRFIGLAAGTRGGRLLGSPSSRLSLRSNSSQFVALTATNHAKMYGLHPKKGTIAVGADADIAIWDPDRKVRISQSLLHHGCDYTPYEGLEVTGWPVTTIVRGKTIVRDGVLIENGCTGGHVARERSPYATPAALRPKQDEVARSEGRS